MAYFSRKSTRLPGFDYTSHNYYFITVCTHQKACIFGTPKKLNCLGEIAKQNLLQIENHFPDVVIDNFIVMPNHIHIIIVIGKNPEKQILPSLSTVVGQYKAAVTKEIHKVFPNMKVWQRSFHDHIIRNQPAYAKIWEYVQYNDQKWEEDCFYQKDNLL